MNLVAARLRALLVVFFDDLWRLVPAEPVFFPFWLVAGVLATVAAPAAIPHLALWSTLAIGAPTLTVLSWFAIFYRKGFTRYLGFWARTAGDLCETIVLGTAFLAYLPVLPLFLSVLLLGIIFFSAVLVVRDVLALWIIEDVASKLHKEVQVDGTAR
jgi:hypothetical protein